MIRAATIRLAILMPELPAGASVQHIRAGSGIVARTSDLESGEPSVSVHYEGNLYGAVNLRRFEDRVRSAGGRLATGYPTAATCRARREELSIVGSAEFSDDGRMVAYALDPAMVPRLMGWVGPDPAP